MKFKPFLLLLLVTTLSACVSKVSSIRQDQDKVLKENVGYLLIGVDTPTDLRAIDIGGEQDIRLTANDLRRGTQYILIDLEAGDYNLAKVDLNGYWRIDLEDGYWDVNIRPGTVSYIGHLTLSKRASMWGYKVVLANRSTEALLFMQKEFPTILNNRSLRYGGPGTDPFLEIMQEGGR